MADVHDLKQTPLHAWHGDNGAKFVPFAGYEMPVQYGLGVMKEHQWTRTHAGLFDVSHMGPVLLTGPDHETVARFLESLMPADIVALQPGRQRYSLLLNEAGGIVDDLMIARSLRRSGEAASRGELLLVLNAGRKDVDTQILKNHLPAGFQLDVLAYCLFALQGPDAEAVLAAYVPGSQDLKFMDARWLEFQGREIHVTRSGYTGEDGFEILCDPSVATAIWEHLVADKRVEPIGLGARDALRIEAGLPLYGNDIDEQTSPIEAGLSWAIGKARRPGGDRAGGFPGADRILGEWADGTSRQRVGLRGEGRAPMRDGTAIYETETSAQPIGTITSGCFGPSVSAAISMAYVPSRLSNAETRVFAEVRGKRLPARVTPMPFHAARYKR